MEGIEEELTARFPTQFEKFKNFKENVEEAVVRYHMK